MAQRKFQVHVAFDYHFRRALTGASVLDRTCFRQRVVIYTFSVLFGAKNGETMVESGRRTNRD